MTLRTPTPLVAVALACASLAWATPAGADSPTVLVADADATRTNLFIQGSGFGNTPPTVTLAGQRLAITAASPTSLVATLPPGLAAGTYLLVVKRGDGNSTQGFEVTLGAVGPAGPIGPAGPAGDAGPPGPPGTTSLSGLQCPGSAQNVAVTVGDGGYVSLRCCPDSLAGTIVAVGVDRLTVDATVVAVDATTQIVGSGGGATDGGTLADGGTSLTLSDLKVGQQVDVTGAPLADGSLAGCTVTVH